MFVKFDNDICNEPWMELEIANIQAEMGDVPYDSEEYHSCLGLIRQYTTEVRLLEDTKLYWAKERYDLIKKGISLAEVVVAGGFALAITRRIFK